MPSFANNTYAFLFGTLIVLGIFLGVREAYRFQLLNSSFARSSTIVASLTVNSFLVLLLITFFLFGWFYALVAFFVSFFIANIVRFIATNFFLDYMADLQARNAVEKKSLQYKLDRFFNDPNIQDILDVYGVHKEILKDLLIRLDAVGNKKAVKNIKNHSKLRRVLDILKNSPKEWADEDRFIEISNFLEYGNK